MKRPAITRVVPSRLQPHVPGLRALEESITYPIGASDSFRIDHGPEYHPFFSALGDAHFMLATDDAEVVGTAVGVVKPIRSAGRESVGLYVCDLKIAPGHRGRGLSRRLLTRGLVEVLRTPALRRARLLYGAAMRGTRGDVMRSAKRWSPLRLGRPLARCAVYFAPPESLAALDVEACPPPPAGEGLELSPGGGPDDASFSSTAGRKDLRLVSSGAPWPLVHLPAGPSSWRPSWGHYLRRCGQRLTALGLAGPACFAVDERLREHVEWLAGRGISASASLTVYGVAAPGLLRRSAWVHIATSEV
jgi:GNAT superfamily N-acetyltransferase